MKHYGRRRQPKDRPGREAPPAEIPAGFLRGRITVELDGRVYQTEIRQAGCDGFKRPRSDTVAARVAGEWRVMSLRAAAATVVEQVPRQLTRSELREYM